MENSWVCMFGFVVIALAFGHTLGKILAKNKIRKLKQASQVSTFVIKNVYISKI